MRLTNMALGVIIVVALAGGARATPDPLADVEQSIDQRFFPDGRRVDFGILSAGQVLTRTLRITNRSPVRGCR